MSDIIHGVKRKPPNPTNWQFAALPQKIFLPERASIKDRFGRVYHQRYSDCTANAVLACDAYYYHKKRWMPSTVFTYYNQKKKIDKTDMSDDGGSSVESALNAVRKFGACNSKVWSNDKPFNEKPTLEAYTDGLKGHEVTKYYQVRTLGQIRQALSHGYPVVVAVAWLFDFMNKYYTLNDVSKERAKKCDSGHAIVIVGYNDSVERFEIRNSWGEGWGNKGYGYIMYETMNNIIWWDDSYTVVR